LAPNEEKFICYTVKIDENPDLYGGIIISNSATAGGVILPCQNIYMGKKLDEINLKKIEDGCIIDDESEIEGIALIKQFYENAGLELYLPDETTLINDLFVKDDVYYQLNANSSCYNMVVPKLYGGFRTNADNTQKGERTVFVDYNLMAGDILICREATAIKTFICAGKEKIIGTFVGGGLMYEGEEYYSVLHSSFGHDVYAVLRPTMAQ
jgi:hypothetical protein